MLVLTIANGIYSIYTVKFKSVYLTKEIKLGYHANILEFSIYILGLDRIRKQ